MILRDWSTAFLRICIGEGDIEDWGLFDWSMDRELEKIDWSRVEGWLLVGRRRGRVGVIGGISVVCLWMVRAGRGRCCCSEREETGNGEPGIRRR